MGRTDRGLLRRIVLREALAARDWLRPPAPSYRGYAAQLRRIHLPRAPVNKPSASAPGLAGWHHWCWLTKAAGRMCCVMTAISCVGLRRPVLLASCAALVRDAP